MQQMRKEISFNMVQPHSTFITVEHKYCFVEWTKNLLIGHSVAIPVMQTWLSFLWPIVSYDIRKLIQENSFN